MTSAALIAAMAALAMQPSLSADGTATPVAESAPPTAVSAPYVLGVADKIRVVVFEEASLSGLFSVGSNGDIAFPLVGPVKAAGLSPDQLEHAIAVLLSNGYMKDPRVNVEVLTFRPYYILGEVTKPGEYPFSSGLTVLKAVATAGGFSYRANEKRVFIKKVGEAGEHAERLTTDTPLEPGDTIRITERFF